jgi:hypothetical protein
VSGTGKPVHSTDLLTGNTGLPVAATDNHAPVATVSSGRHFGKPIPSSYFSPCLLNLLVFSVDKRFLGSIHLGLDYEHMSPFAYTVQFLGCYVHMFLSNVSPKCITHVSYGLL